MNGKMNSLDFLQKSMQEAITNPLNESFDSFAKEVKTNNELSTEQRINIYRHAYFARLFECFQGGFPCLEFALGDKLFRAFAEDFLRKHPSKSYTLYDLSKGFPDYLEASRPDAGLPAEEREDWPDFIIELAQLELKMNEIYFKENEEEAIALLSFKFPVLGFFKAWRRGEEPELPQASEQLVLLKRIDFMVNSRVIDLLEYQYLESISH